MADVVTLDEIPAAGMYKRPVHGEWIRVEDRLPEEGVQVIGYSQSLNQIGEARLTYYGYLVFERDWEDQITHWMPFPAPPKQ